MYLSTLSIHCSTPRCKALFRVEGNTTIGTLNQAAEAEGWKTGLGEKHACPEHNPEASD